MGPMGPKLPSLKKKKLKKSFLFSTFNFMAINIDKLFPKTVIFSTAKNKRCGTGETINPSLPL